MGGVVEWADDNKAGRSRTKYSASDGMGLVDHQCLSALLKISPEITIRKFQSG